MSQRTSVFETFATVLAVSVAAACSPVVDNLHHDGGSSDAPSIGPIKVTAYDLVGLGGPLANAPIVFIDADGTTTTIATDVNGAASATLHQGASATIVNVGTSMTRMDTLTELSPGDNIVFGAPIPSSTSTGMFTVTFTVVTGATSYRVVTPCGVNTATTSPAAISVTAGCTATAAEVLVIAINSSGAPISFVDKTGVAVAAGGTLTMPTTYTAAGSVALSYSNLTGISSISASRAVPGLSGFNSSLTITTAGSTASGTLPLITATTAIESSRFTSATAPTQTQGVAALVDGTTASESLDAAATLLPWVIDASYDIAGRVGTVTTLPADASSATIDVFAFAITWTTTSRSSTWNLFSPRIGSVTYPTLPAALASNGPSATDIVKVTAGAFDSSAFTGWNAVHDDLFTKVGGAPATIGTTIRQTSGP